MATAPPADEILPFYPQLKPQNFRFVEAANIRQFLEREVDNNLTLHKKYEKILTVVEILLYFFVFVILILRVEDMGTFDKIFQHDWALYFKAISFGLDLFAVVLFFIEAKIRNKMETHDEIHAVAASSLFTLMDYFVKAVDDGNISTDELHKILSEHAKYLELRKAVRKRHLHQLDSQDLLKNFRKKFPQKV